MQEFQTLFVKRKYPQTPRISLPMRWIAVVIGCTLAALAPAEVTIRMMAGPSWGIPPKEATDPRSVARRAVFEAFQRENPDIRVVNAGGLEIKGDRAESGFLMSMAADTAPDVFYVNFRQYYNYIDQGFCRPLDDLIAQTPGSLDRANPTVMKVLKSYDGHVYAAPWFQVAQALYYRKDYFAEAGLDPAQPPRDWPELYRDLQKLIEKHPDRIGFAFSKGPAYFWVNYAWQAGAEIVKPAENGYWQAAIATPEGATAVDFYRRMCLDTWKGADGKTYGPVAQISTNLTEDINSGKVAMWFSYTQDIVLNTMELDPSIIGVAQMPAGPAGHANEINAGMWAINASVSSPEKLQACWKFIQFFTSQDAAKISAERYVELGLGNMVNPVLLKEMGYDDIVATVDPAYVKANEELFRSGHPEPYGRNCQQVYVVLDNALDRATLEPQTPAIRILEDTAAEMNRKLLGYTPPDIMARQRGWATGIFIGLLAVLAGWGFMGYRRWRERPRAVAAPSGLAAGTKRSQVVKVMFWCLLPAALSIAIWSYYPLARGLQIAFQDYRITQPPRWVGLDNFISVFTQPIFYKALLNSFFYVFLSILIGFVLPIFLALALNEIPRGKVFFRTLFFLPAMTSPIVVALLWRQFYDKTEAGLLNVILHPFIDALNPLVQAIGLPAIKATHDWLGDPGLAMFAVVLPGIWAAAGPGSILYLAALKNIPDERYEAADIDGANWRQKIRYITLPGLKPLILINLLGIFIGGFKAMENIFVLTMGGPLYSTHTLGLDVWTNAFMFLKFGYATATAWVMGAILIGFTLIQIKSLLKMRFSTSRA